MHGFRSTRFSLRGDSSRADGSHSLDVPLLPSSSLHSTSLLTELEVTFCPRKFSSEDRLLLEVAGGPGRHLSPGSHDHHWGYRLLGEGGGGGGGGEDERGGAISLLWTKFYQWITGT